MMKIINISCLAVFFISGTLAFSNENIVETIVPACDYTRLIINVPSTVKLVANGDSSGRAKGINKELDTLIYTCSNGTFEISASDNVTIKEGLVFELSNGSVSSLTLNGGQDVNITDLAAKGFSLAVNGASTSNFFGKVVDFNVSLNGSAYVEAIYLKSQTGKVNINGSGLVRINVSSALTGEVNGSGRIEYSGIPRIIDTKINGGGSITQVSPKI
ncbi:GIN domain-containing protein [Vibrio fluvialis]|uniref:GIN domain-containing protein n=2 Tax=Vibrio fluvialis TaxID=676 RepID=UPI0028F6DAE1|nr:DUF2807 domain-containing protein [Vibrio fluvialis]